MPTCLEQAEGEPRLGVVLVGGHGVEQVLNPHSGCGGVLVGYSQGYSQGYSEGYS